MSAVKILVIDDSATIRRLADSSLNAAGYQVQLAPDAETGVRFAAEYLPQLILLDHQLPGTTGFEVCQRLLEQPELAAIPVVISSTLRKRAYVEYTDLPNVVDMLPKPYTPELLLTTVANALDTGALIVRSQSEGTAVPEVIDQPGDASLRGDCRLFGLREILDFLNNAGKSGVLEIEGAASRTQFYLRQGRIQGATCSGLDPTWMVERLPESLASLAPVLKLTVAGRASSELDGLVELLDRRVVDPRLLRRLLRFQTALLVGHCFADRLGEFRFDAGRSAPPVVKKLPLDLSLLALLIDGALEGDAGEGGAASEIDEDATFVRCAVRGHNLDRAGMSPHHTRLLGMLGEPITPRELAARSGVEVDEVRCVLGALRRADLVQPHEGPRPRTVVALEPDPAAAQELQKLLEEQDVRFALQVARDPLTLKVLLSRVRPELLFINLEHRGLLDALATLARCEPSPLAGIRLVGLSGGSPPPREPRLDVILRRPFTANHLRQALGHLAKGTVAPATPVDTARTTSHTGAPAHAS